MKNDTHSHVHAQKEIRKNSRIIELITSAGNEYTEISSGVSIRSSSSCPTFLICPSAKKEIPPSLCDGLPCSVSG